MAFETATISSPGGRPENEDSIGYRVLGGAGCWVLADGLGGHRGGEVASKLAVDAVLASFEADGTIRKFALEAHLEKANQTILDRQVAEPELAHMRTTIVAMIASQEAAIWAHAGDSRLYWLRQGKICEQTKDDSVPQRLVDAGEIPPDRIRFHEDRSRLLNTIGAKQRVTASYRETVPNVGEFFLLASDGFWEYVTESEIEQDLECANSTQAWVDKMESRVKSRASADYDNYSAIAVRVLKR